MAKGPQRVTAELYRHGDVLIQRVDARPKSCSKLQHTILAHGEVTGHAHRIAETDGATLFQTKGGELFLEVFADSGATVVHEEHRPILLPAGSYRIWRQREYTPREIRVVRD